ncbi:MAG: aminomethyl-transferring glycine dehydrogenase subunit GcvPB [Clostridia bacterium]|nr:aminomethyl-transferring glycine dehydrogenase subunit GcvPB [Clostridia bacterium]
MNETPLLNYERSVPGRFSDVIPPPDTPAHALPEAFRRKDPPILPELAEIDVSRHYTQLAQRTHGVNNGFYPLGSCTMKYNPAINETAASLAGFLNAHPLAPDHATEGCRAVVEDLSGALCEITGMDAFTLQPAAGAHGELCGVLCIKAYHESRGDAKRTKILVPDSAHGTNPATAAVAGYQVVNVPSQADGCIDLSALQGLLSDEVAGIMLTNPNTLGLFEKDILQIAEMIHAAGGLLYYDGANLNAILGVARPGDMGFDVTHLNLHKTFSTPHGGGGPGSGPVGVKKALIPFLPGASSAGRPARIQMKAFHGNFTVMVRALCYLKTLGGDNLRAVGEHAVLNANYLLHRLKEIGYRPDKDAPCMHEFVLTLQDIRDQYGVTALDVAKALIDHGIHPPTMYFPLIVHEALMFEPTETESLLTLERAVEALNTILKQLREDPESMHGTPRRADIGRPDDVAAARTPILRYAPKAKP